MRLSCRRAAAGNWHTPAAFWDNSGSVRIEFRPLVEPRTCAFSAFKTRGAGAGEWTGGHRSRTDRATPATTVTEACRNHLCVRDDHA